MLEKVWPFESRLARGTLVYLVFACSFWKLLNCSEYSSAFFNGILLHVLLEFVFKNKASGSKEKEVDAQQLSRKKNNYPPLNDMLWEESQL